MQSFDDRSRSMSSSVSTQEVSQAAPFAEPLTHENGFVPLQNVPGQTNLLAVQPASFAPAVTDPVTPLPEFNVPGVFTGALAGSSEGNAQRTPVLIQGSMKRPIAPSQAPHPRRRKIVSLVGIVILFFIISGSLLMATPLGHTIGLSFNASPVGDMQVIGNHSGNNTLNSVVAQATATAVYTNQQSDGYDPNANGNGGVTVGSGNSPRDWPYGQCTYWANYEYHYLSGWWVNWAGNADEWVAGATAAGWNVSTAPHVPSIIVLMPGVQGASYAYGHVAVVTSIINSSTVMSSNMNWYAGGGGLGIVSNYEFNYGPGYYGVYFVWHS